MHSCIIYGLLDPRTDEYRYVGKSVRGTERAKSHINFSHNELVYQWINELKSDNYLPEIIILENVSDASQLIDKEKYWVGKLLNEGYDLLNILITNSLNNKLETYNQKLEKEIKEKTKKLEEKLSHIIIPGNSLTNIGIIIKNRRKELKTLQKNLAEIVGVSINTLYKIERGQLNPTTNSLIKILDGLGLELFITIKN